MACSGLLHSPRLPRSSALLLPASKYHQALRVVHVRGCRDPPAAQRVCGLECPRRGATSQQHLGIPGAKLASQTWVGSASDRTEGMASGVIFPWSLGVCREPWNFFRFSVLRRSGLLCPVRVLHLLALYRGGKTNRQNLHLLTEDI